MVSLMLPLKFNASLPQQVYCANQVRDNEAIIARQCGLAMYQLMENAGEASFELLRKLWPKATKVLVLAGKGNNGGDALVVARLALAAGLEVEVCSVEQTPDYQGDAARAYQNFVQTGGRLTAFAQVDCQHFDVIVDGLLGTGLSGEVRPAYAKVIDIVNAADRPVLSLDVPSGLCADRGRALGVSIYSSACITFVALKQGLLTGAAADYCPSLYLASLGIGERFAQQIATRVELTSGNFLPKLSPRQPSSHKGSSGFVLIFAANKGYGGAGRLAGEAALRAGAGLVALSCDAGNDALVMAGRPELVLASDNYQQPHFKQLLRRAQVVVVGPGLGIDNWARSAWQQALACELPMVVDADALRLLARQPQQRDNWLLTPHPGEAAVLLGCSVKEIEADRFAAVRNIARKYGGCCLLKGAGTLVSDGDKVSINRSGNPGMASAGMGDVLSGIIAALLLQQSCHFDALRLAAYIHGRAADIAGKDGQKGLLASDLFPLIRKLVN
jgi:NAD(P)H-hydrate epimerase